MKSVYEDEKLLNWTRLSIFLLKHGWKWLKSEHTCKMLYQSMHANAFDARRGNDVFEDFYDAALFKDIV